MTDRGEPRIRGGVQSGGFDERSDDLPRGVGGRGSHQPLRAQWDPTQREVKDRSRRPERDVRKQTKLGKFAATYGWRAYAVPILIAVTALVVVDAVRAGDPVVGTASQGTSQDPGFGTLSSDTSGTGIIGVPPQADGNFAETISSGELPDGGGEQA